MGLVAVFLAAVALVFPLLLFLFESFRVAFAILVMTLLAIAAVFVGLWLTGIEINISAMMGMTMIVGIVTEVAIFYLPNTPIAAGNGSGAAADPGRQQPHATDPHVHPGRDFHPPAARVRLGQGPRCNNLWRWRSSPA